MKKFCLMLTLLLGAAIVSAAGEPTPAAVLTAKNAVKLSGAARAEDNSFIGWMQTGSLITLAPDAENYTSCKVTVSGKAGQVIRVLIGKREIIRGKLPSDGKHTVTLKFPAPCSGIIWLHFPQGMNEFYRAEFFK